MELLWEAASLHKTLGKARTYTLSWSAALRTPQRQTDVAARMSHYTIVCCTTGTQPAFEPMAGSLGKIFPISHQRCCVNTVHAQTTTRAQSSCAACQALELQQQHFLLMVPPVATLNSSSKQFNMLTCLCPKVVQCICCVPSLAVNPY